MPEDDHKVLPGITIGDIGPKALGAWGATDQRYAVFNRVRIPRAHMLSKFAQVTEDGKYIKPPHAKISYGGVCIKLYLSVSLPDRFIVKMMYIRSRLVNSTGMRPFETIESF